MPIDTLQLIKGVRFSCPTCFTSIGIAPESINTVENAMTKFEALKNNVQEEGQKQLPNH